MVSPSETPTTLPVKSPRTGVERYHTVDAAMTNSTSASGTEKGRMSLLRRFTRATLALGVVVSCGRLDFCKGDGAKW